MQGFHHLSHFALPSISFWELDFSQSLGTFVLHVFPLTASWAAVILYVICDMDLIFESTDGKNHF